MTGLVACVLFLLLLQKCLCAINEDILTLTCSDGVKISGSRSMLEMFCDTRGNSEHSFRKIIPDLDLSSVKELDASNTELKDDFSFVERLLSLERLRICVRGSTTVFLNALSQIQGLKELNLFHSNLSNLSDLVFVEKLSSLEILNLNNCKLTSASLNTLSRIESLRELDLSWNDFSASLDLRFVEKLPSLEKLVLSCCKLTSACLNTLSEIENLKELNLSHSNLSASLDLGFVEKLSSLEKLNLGNCKLTSASLKTLSGIERHESLRELYLYGNDFSASLDLGSIAKLPSLKVLDLSCYSLTPESKSRISELMNGRKCDLKLWP